MGTSAKEPKRGWGLCQRRECLVLTWRGRFLLLVLGASLAFAAARGASPFLAVNDPVVGGALVVEGWAPDYALAEAMAEFKRNPYTRLYVTGGPIEKGAPLSEYKTFAEFGAATLIRMGMASNLVQAVPAPPVRQDRTYASAVALRNWLREHGAAPQDCHVLSVGPHARRTRLMFEKALGGTTRVGITSIESPDHDPKRWWRTSAGVRTVLGEVIAYVYARLFFWPPRP